MIVNIYIVLATPMGMFHMKFKEITISLNTDGQFSAEGVQE